MGLAGPIESSVTMATVAEGFVVGRSTPAHGDPLSLRNGIGITLLVYQINGAGYAIWSVSPDLDLDVCHLVILQRVYELDAAWGISSFGRAAGLVCHPALQVSSVIFQRTGAP
jgi:hypothetical protein